MGKKVNFCDEEVSACCIIHTLVSELRGKKRKTKSRTSPFWPQRLQLLKKIHYRHSMHLFFYSCFVASVLSISHHWDYRVQGSSETILNELFHRWQSPFPSPLSPSGYLSFETFLYTFSKQFYKRSQSSWLPITCCKGEHGPYKAPTLQPYGQRSRRGR